MSNERINSIADIKRSFDVSEPVTAIVKPRGFVAWCKAPYPGHPNGCPNFGIKKDCPPNAPYFLDVYKPEVKIAYLKFNFSEYLNWRESNHPDWTEKALRNSRHYQEHLRSSLRKEIKNLENLESSVTLFNAEAMCVNIHQACGKVGIELQWPPNDTMYRIALLAMPK